MKKRINLTLLSLGLCTCIVFAKDINGILFHFTNEVIPPAPKAEVTPSSNVKNDNNSNMVEQSSCPNSVSLLFSLESSNSILSYSSNGDGTFNTTTTTTNTPVGNLGVSSVEETFYEDVTSDGIPDLVNAWENNVIRVWPGNADGTFQPFTEQNINGQITNLGTWHDQATFMGDTNGDHQPDIVFSQEQDNRINVYLGNGDGTFNLNPVVTNTPVGTLSNWNNEESFLIDVDVDGILDLIFMRERNFIRFWKGNGDGTFQAFTEQSIAGLIPDLGIDGRQATHMGDANNDLIPDILFSHENANTINIYTGNGDGTFNTTPIVTSTPIGNLGTSGVETTFYIDITSDGIPDLVNTWENTQIRVWAGNGDGTFQAFTDQNISGQIPDLGEGHNQKTFLQNTCPRPCFLSDAGKLLETCDNNSTSGDGTDDFVRFSLNPRGVVLGGTYTVTVDNGATVTPTTGTYGSATQFRLQNGSADGTLYTITITDDDDTGCEITTTVQRNSCSSEICDNGIDDDGDGLVDSFDTDCPCNDSYNAQCTVECSDTQPGQPIQLQEKWKTDRVMGIFPNITVGDIDNDGQAEGIVAANGGGNIHIVDLSDGSIERTFAGPPVGGAFAETDMISIGDVDNDGDGEIFILSRSDGHLFSYDHLGNQLWTSDVALPNTYWVTQHPYTTVASVNLADFNADGIPEVYVGAAIFNARTGVQLAIGNEGRGQNTAVAWNTVNTVTVAGDLLPGTPGLELAAGRTVYKVTIANTNGTTGNTITPVNAPTGIADGFTAIADVDGDGLLDVVTNGPGGVRVWNPRNTPSLIASGSGGSSGGVPFIGDVDGDCAVEIGVTYIRTTIMYEYSGSTSLTQKWSVSHTDNSGSGGLSMFDLNQDGNNELFFRDETNFMVYNAATGDIVTSIPCTSGSGMEYPVIVDIDNDDEAEILLLCDAVSNGTVPSALAAYESANVPWAPARSVWNQHSYNSTNVNDDLTIPIQPQNPAAFFTCADGCPQPYNNFNQQATLHTQDGCVAFEVCPEDCNNGIDDDGDGLIDCQDVVECPCEIEVDSCVPEHDIPDRNLILIDAGRLPNGQIVQYVNAGDLSANDTNFNQDFGLRLLNSDGTEAVFKTWNFGSSSENLAQDMEIIGNDIYVVGRRGISDAFVAKFDTSLNLVWSRSIPLDNGNNVLYSGFASITAIDSGSLLISGEKVVSGNNRVFNVVVTSTGDVTVRAPNDPWQREAYDSKVLANGNYYEAQTGGSGQFSVAVAKNNANGDRIWVRYYPYPAFPTSDFYAPLLLASGSKLIDEGALIAVSRKELGAVEFSIYDQNGDVARSVRYTAPGGAVIQITGMEYTDDGYIAAGEIEFPGGAIDLFAMRLNSDLSVVWAKRYESLGDDKQFFFHEYSANGIVRLSGNAYYVLGGTNVNGANRTLPNLFIDGDGNGPARGCFSNALDVALTAGATPNTTFSQAAATGVDLIIPPDTTVPTLTDESTSLACCECNLQDTGETEETCNDNGTSLDGSDDYITFKLNPIGQELSATYTVSVDNGGTISPSSGTYGVETEFRLQDGSADGTIYTVTVTDDVDPACQVITEVQQDPCISEPTDMAISLIITDGIVTGIEEQTFYIRIRELLGKETNDNSDIEIRLDRDSRLTLNYNSALTQIDVGGSLLSVSNSAWNFDNTDPSFYIWRNTGTLLANETSAFGFVGEFDPGRTDGQVSLTVRIVAGSGGDSNPNNNLDAYRIDFFQE